MSSSLNRKDRRKMTNKQIMDILSNVRAEVSITFLYLPIYVLFKKYGFVGDKLNQFVTDMMDTYNEIENFEEFAINAANETGVELQRIDEVNR